MALIDVVKFDGLKSRDWLVYKHYAEDLVIGTQLIVGEGQAAVFVKGGQVCDTFTSGTHTLSTKNLPILDKLINLPFGNRTPFTAEIFYLNTATKLDMYWGTNSPIQLIDPKFNIKLSVRAYGQMGLKLSNPSLFFKELIGALPAGELVNYEKVSSFYKGLVVQKVKSIISSYIINQRISALEITAKLDEISNESKDKISAAFEEFGLSVVSFYINSIDFPEENFNAINAILEKNAEFNILGDEHYKTMRAFDVYQDAAQNETGAAGALFAGGVGLSMGLNNANNSVPSMPTETTNQSGTVICSSCGVKNAFGSKFCNSCGSSLAKPTKICPNCNEEIAEESMFCSKCGHSFKEKKCVECGNDLKPDQKFCSKCGKEV